MLLHLLHGDDQDAEVVYETIQQQYTASNAGYPYAEMAKEFLEEYAASHDMDAACAAATDYARENEEILEPLGSRIHGWWTLRYKPSDICPFTNADRTGMN